MTADAAALPLTMPVLDPHVIYVTAGGHVDARDVDEWAGYGLGPIVCQCGERQAIALVDTLGRAVTFSREQAST